MRVYNCPLRVASNLKLKRSSSEIDSQFFQFGVEYVTQLKDVRIAPKSMIFRVLSSLKSTCHAVRVNELCSSPIKTPNEPPPSCAVTYTKRSTL
jgi:hypothetical protein